MEILRRAELRPLAEYARGGSGDSCCCRPRVLAGWQAKPFDKYPFMRAAGAKTFLKIFVLVFTLSSCVSMIDL